MKVIEIATAVAHVLSTAVRPDNSPAGEWIGKQPNNVDWYAYAQRHDGLTLYFNTSHYKDRLGISLSLDHKLHKYRSSNLPMPSITVSLAKDATAIARDITRRLLDEAEGVFAQVLARKAQANAYQDRCNATLSRIIYAGEGLFTRSMTPESLEISTRGYHAAGRSWYLHNSHASDDSVHLDFNNLPVELAIQIVQAVAKYERKRELAAIADESEE